jgi:hypothetical protein
MEKDAGRYSLTTAPVGLGIIGHILWIALDRHHFTGMARLDMAVLQGALCVTKKAAQFPWRAAAK